MIPRSWRVYAIAFATWLDYSGVFQLRGQLLCQASTVSKIRLLGGGEQGRQKTFPQTTPKIALALLESKLAGTINAAVITSSTQKSINDLQILGLLDDQFQIIDRELAAKICDPQQRAVHLKRLLANVPGGESALKLLEQTPRARPEEIGMLLRGAYGLPWVASTTSMAGSKFRSWAVASGTKTMPVARKKITKFTDQLELSE